MKRRKEFLLLAIDIGNTSATFGLFKNRALAKRWFGEDDIIPQIDSFLKKDGSKCMVDKVILCSVNPLLSNKIMRSLSKISNKEDILVVSPDMIKGFKHKYFSINKLGRDRLVDLYGAMIFYKLPVLVINFGTATTFDIISNKGVYEGGLIVPGIETAWNALGKRAALLPKVAFSRVGSYRKLLGHDTISCMVAGSLQGFGAMVDGLIARFKGRFGSKIKVIACGGLAKRIAPYVKSRMTVDLDHTLESLAFLFFGMVRKSADKNQMEMRKEI